MTGVLFVAAMVAAALVLLAREEAVLRGNGDRLWRSLGDLGYSLAHAPARILHPVGHSADQGADEWADEWDDGDDDRDDEADEPAARDADAES